MGDLPSTSPPVGGALELPVFQIPTYAPLVPYWGYWGITMIGALSSSQFTAPISCYALVAKRLRMRGRYNDVINEYSVIT